MSEIYNDFVEEYFENAWGPHELCMFNCGKPDCTQEALKDPIVSIICNHGIIHHCVQAHWEAGDRSVGIHEGYFLEEDFACVKDEYCRIYIISPSFAADVLPEHLKHYVE